MGRALSKRVVVVAPVSRRVFLADVGMVSIALVLGVAACSDDDGDGDVGPATSGSRAATTTTMQAPVSTAAVSPTAASPPTTIGEVAELTWERANLGFVSAYVLVRGGEGAIVDTGVEGSVGPIGSALTSLGIGWGDVGQVIVTHRHGDHAGSLTAVMEEAAGATGYAGAADMAAMTSPRPLVAVTDGDSVFDLDIIATPGHTAGHISVLDTAAGVLLAGDALRGADGGVIGIDPRASSDIVAGDASIAKLAGFQFETVLFGHGEPVLAAASSLVAELAASL